MKRPNTYLMTEGSHLSEMTWGAWKRFGGCSLSDLSRDAVAVALNMPESRWEEVTLGEIASAYIVANRELARFALEHLCLVESVVVKGYEDEN